MILSINFFKDINVPKVRFDLLIEYEDRSLFHDYPLPYIAESQTTDKKKRKELEKALGEEHFDYSEFTARRYGNKHYFIQRSIAYVIPDNPLLALQFLNAMTEYFATAVHQSKKISHIIINAGFISDHLDKHVTKPKLNFVQNLYVTFHPELNQTITEYRLNISIEKLLENAIDRNTITEQFRSEFSKMRDMPSHHAIVTTSLAEEPGLEPIERRKKVLKSVLDLAKVLITDGKEAQLESILTVFHTAIIKKLFESCIGKRADDGKKYGLGHTEWGFLQHAVLKAGKDGLMRILDIQDNPGYQEHYAKGRRNHSIFAREIIHFWKAVGLELQPGCDLHIEQVFTAESSEKLKEAGAFTVPQIKHLLYARNITGFFNRSVYVPNTQEKEFSLYNALFNDLPYELKDMIIDQVGKIDPNINSEDLKLVREMGLSRGMSM